MSGGKTCHSLRLDFTHNVSLRQPFNVLVNLFSGEAVQVRYGKIKSWVAQSVFSEQRDTSTVMTSAFYSTFTALVKAWSCPVVLTYLVFG